MTLLDAVRKNDDTEVKRLLAAGTKLDEKVPNDYCLWRNVGTVFGGRMTLLHAAAGEDAAAVIPLLVSAGLDVDGQSPHGVTPLLVASHRGHVASVKALLALGASTKHGDAMEHDAIDHASNLATVTELLAAGANPNGRAGPKNPDGRDYHTWPVLIRRPAAVVEALLVAGADAKAPRALAIAAHYGHTDIVRLLLDHGADPNDRLPDHTNASALAAAAPWGRVEEVRMLLARGATDVDFALAIACAAQSQFSVDPDPNDNLAERAEVVRLLLDAGALPSKPANVRIAKNTTALHLAVAFGSAEMVEVLAKHEKVEVDRLDGDGRTALMLAADRPSVAMIDALMAAGADPKIRHAKGWGVYEYAKNAKASEERIAVLAKLAALGLQPAPPKTTPKVPSLADRAVGAKVRHSKFGEGVVTALTGSGPTLKATIDFAGESKTLIADFVTWL